ncbi:cytochrome c556 [Fulvimarina pelagi HTCC2506]|uniref:Cytochrome c556 n=2 Tax=Fulvimarina pelagi TaxID=217511 RepID=Q0G4T3_9HYPH|nr:cytochrome c556 [Fulvimarina pelagi HTCC2506]
MRISSFRISTSILAAASMLFAASAVAQNTAPIKERQELMESNGDSAKAASAMIKGEQPFDAAKAKQIFNDIHGVAMKFGDYFPEDSKTGNETEAAPAIWEQPEEFEAALTKFQEESATAMEASVEDLESFRQQFGMVAENCKGCHEDFRIDDD